MLRKAIRTFNFFRVNFEKRCLSMLALKYNQSIEIIKKASEIM